MRNKSRGCIIIVALLVMPVLSIVIIDNVNIALSRQRLRELCALRVNPRIYDGNTWTTWSSSIRRITNRVGYDDPSQRPAMINMARGSNIRQAWFSRHPFAFPYQTVQVDRLYLVYRDKYVASVDLYSAGMAGLFFGPLTGNGKGGVDTCDRDWIAKYNSLISHEFAPIVPSITVTYSEANRL